VIIARVARVFLSADRDSHLTSHSTSLFFFLNATTTTEIYTLSLHDALPISESYRQDNKPGTFLQTQMTGCNGKCIYHFSQGNDPDRKSTRLNSSHVSISYAVFCLKKKKYNKTHIKQQSQKYRNHHV